MLFRVNISVLLLIFCTNNLYSQLFEELNPQTAFDFFKFCLKLDESYNPDLSKIEIKQVDKGNVAELNVLKENEKYIIEVTTKFDTIIREHILIEGLYQSNSILPLIGSGFGGIDLYYNYYTYIDKDPRLSALVGDVADFGIFKEARLANEKLEYLLCYNFIYYHELFHIFNGHVEKKIKINQKILKSYKRGDFNKVEKLQKSIIDLEIQADAFAFLKYSKSVHNLINGLSEYFIESTTKTNEGLAHRGAEEFPNYYDECSPITTRTLVILKNLENKNISKKNLVTPQERLLKIIEKQKKYGCTSVETEDENSTPSEQDGFALLLRLFEVASQNNYPKGYVTHLMDSLKHDSLYIKLPEGKRLDFF